MVSRALVSFPLAIALGLALTVGLSGPTAAQVLATGQFEVAGRIEGEPFSGDIFRRFSARHTLPADLGPTAGRQLAVRLQDISDPDQVCSFDHPLSGCVTVDWTMNPNNVFRNLMTIQTVIGSVEFHLRMNDTLASSPEPAHPQ